MLRAACEFSENELNDAKPLQEACTVGSEVGAYLV